MATVTLSDAALDALQTSLAADVVQSRPILNSQTGDPDAPRPVYDSMRDPYGPGHPKSWARPCPVAAPVTGTDSSDFSGGGGDFGGGGASGSW